MEFVHPFTYLYLYKSLVRSQLEYAVPGRDPFYSKFSNAIRKVQIKFLKDMHYLCFRTHASYSDFLNRDQLENKKPTYFLEPP